MIHAYHNFLLEIADLENTVYPVFGRTRRCHSQKLDYVPILWDKHTNITRSLVLDSGHKDCKQCWYDQDGHACFDDDSRIFQQLDISKKAVGQARWCLPTTTDAFDCGTWMSWCHTVPALDSFVNSSIPSTIGWICLHALGMSSLRSIGSNIWLQLKM